MNKLNFPVIRITQGQDHRVLPEDVVTPEDAKEIADRINSAFAKCSEVATLAILTDGLVSLYQQFGMTPVMTLEALGTAVSGATGGRVKADLVRLEDLKVEREQAERLSRIRPVRRRHH